MEFNVREKQKLKKQKNYYFFYRWNPKEKTGKKSWLKRQL
jgi:hypothetical protein